MYLAVCLSCGDLQAMNREFLEETGARGNFKPEHHLCVTLQGPATRCIVNHLFVRIERDAAEFSRLLRCFGGDEHLSQMNSGYLNEVFAVTGLPIFIEGPEVASTASKLDPWRIHGLPRYISTGQSSPLRSQSQCCEAI